MHKNILVVDIENKKAGAAERERSPNPAHIPYKLNFLVFGQDKVGHLKPAQSVLHETPPVPVV